MIPSIMVIFMASMGLGIVLAFSSSNWFMAWMGLELNAIAILPRMIMNHHPRAVESTTKYFIVQAAAAATLLFAATTHIWLEGDFNIETTKNTYAIAIFTIALVLKLGLAPCHSWMPEVLQGQDLLTGLILSTWQKLAPAILLMNTHTDRPWVLALVGITSTLVGGLGGLNQTQLRKLLAYSSIAHMGWIALITPFSYYMALIALLVYFALSFAVFIALYVNRTKNLLSLATSMTMNPTLMVLTCLVVLSLGGLPPLTGFLPKWFILTELVKQGLMPVATMAALTSLLSLSFYLRMAYTATLTSHPHPRTILFRWHIFTHRPTAPLAMAFVLALAFLPLTPAMVTFLLFFSL
uniref:NADH-ubiquinone oxidoreductase chain 2 n=1 Tax=Sphyraena japonica TaxID=392545 RepID=T2HTI6_SPHJA|nr:NADH dehydrogenase subunit 2 [Sphyraena japonica]BAN83452.1 NADH dehydrogenase subunit 2 [Sphyraena japonica]